jgi:hypothetical protein
MAPDHERATTMHTWDFQTGVIRLTRSTKKLRDDWAETKEHWSDQNQRDFERNHLDPLAPTITLTLTAVQRLAEVFEQARRECSDEPD